MTVKQSVMFVPYRFSIVSLIFCLISHESAKGMMEPYRHRYSGFILPPKLVRELGSVARK